MADTDLIKDIPGYKAILKSVLKSQIQLLLEQLSDQAEEESIILTASVTDGVLSHLGSSTGKGFLEGRDEVKSQFLGYCLKSHHRKQPSQSDNTSTQQSSSLPSNPDTPTAYRIQTPIRQPRPGPYQRPSHYRQIDTYSAHPLKNSPYNSPFSNTPGKPSLNKITQGNLSAPSTQPYGGIITLPVSSPNMTIKTETVSVKQEGDNGTSDISNSASAQAQGYGDNDAINSQLAESGRDGTESRQGSTSDHNDSAPLDSVKIEALTEDEFDLEITGVEPGAVGWEQADQQVNMDNSGLRIQSMEFTCDDGDSFRIEQIDESVSDFGNDVKEPLIEDTVTPGSSKTDDKKPFSCKLCEYTTGSSGNLSRHNRAVHKKIRAKCDKCSRHFSSIYDLREHVSVVHEGTKLLCEFCSKEFNNRHTLWRHINFKHKGKPKFLCSICGKNFWEKASYLDHINKHNNTKPFTCHICDGKFANKQNYIRHLQTVHADNSQNVNCELCGSSFKTKDRLNDHMKGKHGPKQFMCECGVEFAWRMSLIRHKKKCKAKRSK